MAKKARVIIELEENFADEVGDDTFEDYDEIDNIGDFAELVWQKRLEDIDMDSRIMNIDCHKIDD